jgi:acyl-coenzyme A synthetase/AMP-(fatty) acid ligase
MQPTVTRNSASFDENRNEIEGNQVVEVCIKFPWPGIAQFGVTIRGIGYLFFSLPGTYFTGDGLYEMK